MRIIGNFTDEAIPLSPSASSESSTKLSRSRNAGVVPFADFKETAQPISAIPGPTIERAVDQLAALIVKQDDPAKVSALVQQRLLAQIQTLQQGPASDHRDGA